MSYDSEEVGSRICAEIAGGDKSLTEVLLAEGMPTRGTFYVWLSRDKELSDKYTRACEQRAEFLADQIVSISDEQSEVVTETGHKFDPDVNRDRLRIDARKWYASKVYPKKYGDKVTHQGDAAAPFVVKVIEEIVDGTPPTDS